MLVVFNPEQGIYRVLGGGAARPWLPRRARNCRRGSMRGTERRLKGCWLRALHKGRSARLWGKPLDYNFLFRWYLELAAKEAAFDHWTFSRKRARLLEHELAGECLRAVVAQARGRNLGSDQPFTLEGGQADGDCHGARRRQASPQYTPAPRPAWPRRARARKPRCAPRPTPG